MLTHVEPRDFVVANQRSRTRPATLICETAAGDEIEVIAKFSAFCEQGAVHLAREVVSACLAADLSLPVAKPVLVDLSDEWIESVIEPSYRARLQKSARVGFGSTFIPHLPIWNQGIVLNEKTLPIAAAIFAFDAIIQNPDRRADNPNCLVGSDQFLIIDHELAFSHQQILFWKPPWMPGSLQALEQPGNHIFREGLRKPSLDFQPIRASWSTITDDRLLEYKQAIPMEWADATKEVDAALSLIRDARDHIDECMVEIQRVLK